MRQVVVHFVDRTDAGRRLAGSVLRSLAVESGDVVVLGLPGGGVPVAVEVARALDAPLDVLVVRKLGLPAQPELAMGAVGEDGTCVVNDDVARHAVPGAFAAVEQHERAEVERRARAWRGARPAVALTDRTVVIVDDGVATGATARAACQVARTRGARRVVLAVPVGPVGVRDLLRPDADEVVCLDSPVRFDSVGARYDDFRQVSEDEVAALLAHADAR